MDTNTFINGLKKEVNYKYTENGALAHKSTLSKVYDMFAFGGAYRQRSEDDCLCLFDEAYQEDPVLAVKCLFYLRDCRGGAGERRFFRVCFKWLCKYHPDHAYKLLIYIPEYGRWDDLVYTTIGTPVWEKAISIIKRQLILDLDSKTPSLLAKWLPSENASSPTTKAAARGVRKVLEMTPKQYRKTLAVLRKRINIVERLMSENRWDEIEFDKIPSKAGLIYKNAFARRDIIAQKYEEFIKDEKTTVNAGTLFPYEVVQKVTSKIGYNGNINLSDTDRAAINKYWANLPDYFEGAPASMICVVDTSGSMTWGPNNRVAPIDVAISLGLYCAERIGGPFHNHYISFASRPQLIETVGFDFVEKVKRIYNTNLCDNTNLEAVFDLILRTVIKNDVNVEDVPTLVIISDMEVDGALGEWWGNEEDTRNNFLTLMEQIRNKWRKNTFHNFPRLVYWNVNARNNTVLDMAPGVSYVSGASPIIFKQVMTGKTGYDLMLETLLSDRYKYIN